MVFDDKDLEDIFWLCKEEYSEGIVEAFKGAYSYNIYSLSKLSEDRRTDMRETRLLGA